MPTLKLTEDKDALELSLSGLSGPDFQRGLTVAKSVTGRWYNGDKKVWVLPADPGEAEKVMLAVRPNADAALLSWIKASRAERQKELITPIPDDAEVFVPWRDKLYDFQRAFVAWAAEHDALILADDMGLGKTFQAISAQAERQIREKAEDGPKLVICPNSVKGVWARELTKWLGADTPYVIVDAATPAKRNKQLREAIDADGWAIVNWEQIRVKSEEVEEPVKIKKPDGSTRDEVRKVTKWFLREPLFGTTPWVSVFADEAHRAKSRTALQTRGLWHIDAPFKLALSGTPMMNSPDELWPVLHWLFPKEYTSYWRFFNTYVDHYDGHYNNKIITGVKNPDALRFELSTRLVRRTKGDKLDLPPKVREVVPVYLGPKQRKLYDEAEKQMWLSVEQAIKEGDRAAAKFAEQAIKGEVSVVDLPNGAVRTMRQRQIASTPFNLGAEDVSAKLDAAVEIILDAQPKQFVVFSAFKPTCEALKNRLTAKGLIVKTFTGDDTPTERTQMEDDFQAGEIDVLVGTIAAMGEGVTLTAADTAIFIERHWTPAPNDQAEDRLWRNGQENRVTILILEAQDTVDTDKVVPTNNVKRMMVGAVIQQDAVEETVRETDTTKGDTHE